jgi:DNA-binding protein YbaB
MFDQLKGMASIAGLMRDLPRLKSRVEEVKRRLAERLVEADAGGGAVRVVACAQMRVVSVRVDPALMAAIVNPADESDREMAEALVAGAVNAALERARAAAEQEMRDVAADLGISLPPGLEGML